MAQGLATPVADDSRGRDERVLSAMLLGTTLLVLVQAGLGMAANLYVTVPKHHPGSHPSNYLTGSYRSVTWVIGNGAVVLAVHAALGLAMVVIVIGVVVHAVRAEQRAVFYWSLLGGLLVIGAGFNGASFLDFNTDTSSLIMALLALGAVGCFAVALFLTGRERADGTASAP